MLLSSMYCNPFGPRPSPRGLLGLRRPSLRECAPSQAKRESGLCGSDRLRLLVCRCACARPTIVAQAAPPPPMAPRFFAPLEIRELYLTRRLLLGRSDRDYAPCVK